MQQNKDGMQSPTDIKKTVKRGHYWKMLLKIAENYIKDSLKLHHLTECWNVENFKSVRNFLFTHESGSKFVETNFALISEY